MDVDPNVYYDGGKTCSDLADTIHSAFKQNDTKLRTCSQAAGSDSTGKEWAAQYDQRLTDLYELVYGSIIPALDNYAGVLVQGGYNWALANFNAHHEQNAQPPTKPPLRPLNTRKPGLVHIADGPGNGLVDGAIGLANAIGIPVPDGDTDQLQQVVDAWNQLVTEWSDRIRSPLDGLVRTFGSSNAPEAPDVVDDLRDFQSAVDDMLAGCSELAGMVQDQRDAIDHLRRELLAEALNALAFEVGTRAVLAFAGSFVTFGLAAAVGAGAVAAAVAKYAPRIAKIIKEWNEAKKLRAAQKAQRDLAAARKRADELKSRGKHEGDGADSSAPGPRSPAGRFSGDLEKVNVHDPDADKLAEKIGGESSVKFKNDPKSKEFDVVSDEFIGEAKPGGLQLGSDFRNQAKVAFEAAQETGRKVYYHFDGPPGPGVAEKLQEYSQRYGVEVVVDTTPF